MKRITTGDLALAIRKYRPIVTDDMVRVWAERGLIPADRNPGNERGWWYLLPESLKLALSENIGLLPHEVVGILKTLGLSEGKQLQLEVFRKKSESQNLSLLIWQKVAQRIGAGNKIFLLDGRVNPLPGCRE